MRCLYCGKELALLKRLTGGGEFCSDAHRQQYQDEYNQLALTRLLQAKPPGTEDLPEAKSAPAAPPQETPKPSRARAPQLERQPIENQIAPVPPASKAAPLIESASPKPRPEQRIAPAAPEPIAAFVPGGTPQPEPEPAEMSSFLVELPVPAFAEVMSMARTDSEFEHGSAPSLPQRQHDPLESRLSPAGPVDLAPFAQAVDFVTRPRDRKLDVREFVRAAPVVRVDLDGTGMPVLPEMIGEPMDILIFPHPPQGSPPLWGEPWREFSFENDLGVLARVTFRTTGVEDNQELSDLPESLEASPASVPARIAAQVPTSEKVESEPAPAVAVAAVATKTEAVNPDAPAATPALASPAKPAATTVPKPVFRPTPSLVRPPSPPAPVPSPARVESKVEKTPELETAPAAVKTANTVPALVTKPLPLTLHGLAAGRGKPVQIFAAVTAGVDVQVPRSNSLPLRPVMTLGPAAVLEKPVEEKKPADRSVVARVDPRRNQPSRPDPRFANGKSRKDSRPSEAEKVPESVQAPKKDPVKKEPEKNDPDKIEIAAAATSTKLAEKSTPKQVEAPAAKPSVTSAAQPFELTPAKSRDRNREKTLPAPLAAPYSTPDLGLPSLNLDASGGFWSRLPIAGKAGLALALIVVIAGVFYFMRPGPTPVAAGPRIVEAPAITADEGGWITDWGAEPGVRKAHELSVLRATLNMTDYRIQFEAQIESKALGWIYRAQDAKNYYVSKLEIVKPGLTPVVALVRYAVLNGEEQPHAQFPLNMPLRIDTLYKVRFDAIGDHFTTWVQDQKVDDWTDQHLKTGGVGLYSDRGERISLKGSMRVAPLVLKK